MAKGLKTGGRRPGSKNKATQERERIIANSGLTPLEYLLSVMRSTADEGTRIDAAKAAAPYVHPKLANVELSGNKDAPLQVEIVRYANTPTK